MHKRGKKRGGKRGELRVGWGSRGLETHSGVKNERAKGIARGVCMGEHWANACNGGTIY